MSDNNECDFNKSLYFVFWFFLRRVQSFTFKYDVKYRIYLFLDVLYYVIFQFGEIV